MMKLICQHKTKVSFTFLIFFVISCSVKVAEVEVKDGLYLSKADNKPLNGIVEYIVGGDVKFAGNYTNGVPNGDWNATLNGSDEKIGYGFSKALHHYSEDLKQYNLDKAYCTVDLKIADRFAQLYLNNLQAENDIAFCAEVAKKVFKDFQPQYKITSVVVSDVYIKKQYKFLSSIVDNENIVVDSNNASSYIIR
jgi:hypothetical protein